MLQVLDPAWAEADDQSFDQPGKKDRCSRRVRVGPIVPLLALIRNVGTVSGRLQRSKSMNSATRMGLAGEVDDGPGIDGEVRITDFDVLKVVGRGGFGKVMQVRKIDGGQVSHGLQLQSLLRTSAAAVC